ncbi:MAG: APC family permease, partial [Actinomycetia bacterium]|nr:APC family permease [Actinomycetes bacterium]
MSAPKSAEESAATSPDATAGSPESAAISSTDVQSNTARISSQPQGQPATTSATSKSETQHSSTPSAGLPAVIVATESEADGGPSQPNVSTFKRLKRSILGRPLGDSVESSEKYSVFWGLPVLSSDAISSVAYAVEEIMLVLVPVLGMAAFAPVFGVAALIILLCWTLAFCYRQTVDIFPEGGGAYSVARANFGKLPSLIAGGALLVDYILTVAVSSSSGTAAIISIWPQISFLAVPMTIFFILLLTFGNLRGLRESSVAFGIPTYLFISAMMIMIITGLIKALLGGAPMDLGSTFQQPASDLTIFLFLRAFSSGSAALTGVEAISNSVPNFKAPSQKHAKRTLMLMALIITLVFGGSSVLAALYQATPQANVTVIATIAISVFGANNFMFYVVQITTAVILVMAANTVYNGLPALMRLMASHNFMPHYFANKGSRLVYSSGIIFVTVFAVILVLIFQADTHLLIPLYAIGAFTAFTISQAGMLKHWLVTREGNWHHKAAINGLGMILAGTATVIIGVYKFTQGAWIAFLIVALMVFLMLAINRHYTKVRKDLAISAEQFQKHIRPPAHDLRIVLPMQNISRPFLKALNYAREMGDDIVIIHVSTNEKDARNIQAKYNKLDLSIPLIIEMTDFRNVNEVLLHYIDAEHQALEEGQSLTVVMPQLIVQHWWQNILHNQTALALEMSLLGRRNIAVVMIPFIPQPEKPKDVQRAARRIKEIRSQSSVRLT